jgi:molybdopterin synthase catalytic subunit
MTVMPVASPSIDIQVLEHPVRPASMEPFPQSAGAECAFVGRTRMDVHPRHGALVELVYEAYVPLARRVLADLAEDAAVRFGCQALRIHHATGTVPIGQASVLVQVACGHRGDAFAACRFLIDGIKSTAPIWKRQRWADAATWSTGTAVEPPEPRQQAGG